MTPAPVAARAIVCTEGQTAQVCVTFWSFFFSPSWHGPTVFCTLQMQHMYLFFDIACLCMNGGRCNGSACACPPSFVGTLCGAACTISCPQGYVLNPYGCGCDRGRASCVCKLVCVFQYKWFALVVCFGC